MGVIKKSTLCALSKMLIIVNDPLSKHENNINVSQFIVNISVPCKI